MTFGLLDTFVFIFYIVGTIVFAMWMASRHRSAAGFFKADKQIPWYVVGASIISAGVSSEQFIGTVGIAFLYGMAIANWQWGAPVVYTILIFVFLPFYMRGNVTTMPEFLERRFNTVCRRIYALVSITTMAFVMLGVVMFAGAKAVNVLFPAVSVPLAILLLAAIAGTYSVYGGLLASVWADFLQYIVLMVGGCIVGFYALHYSGGIGNLLSQMPEKAIMLYGVDHEVMPWFGTLASMFSLGIWYSCANQLIVQRFLGARSEWDARMGVIMAGFSMAIFPLMIVIPGIAAFYIFHDQLGDGDRSWAYLVQAMLPSGVVGIVLAGLASSVLGTLAALVNSSSTIFTYDIYQPLFRKNAGDKELYRTGRISAAIFLAVGVVVAQIVSGSAVPIFVMIQTALSYMAAPIAAVFFVGILWKRATPAAATITLILGFASIYPVVQFIFPRTFLAQYDSFSHHTFMVFIFSLLCITVLSLFTKPKPQSELAGVVWDRSALRLPESERALNSGIRDFRLWWMLMVLVIVTVYVFTGMRAGNTVWLEAEKIPFNAVGGETRQQERKEIPNFNLWTDSRQVLFTPSGADASLRFQVPVDETGQHKLAAVVTRGPGYGSFTVSVNGTTSTLQLTHTLPGDSAKTYKVEKVQTHVYDADTSQPPALLGALPGRYVVQRIEIGTFPLQKGPNELEFRLAEGNSAFPGRPNFIGVDQIIVTPERK